ncbi:12-oxophytodienoate reductase [Rhodococcus sp. X156]|uniref:oxidoreductase n=1 Tax=Rhodococcus sp. X156 TaxID=2499145 RepID=UPI000FDB4612|nr:12-oxophytodienoate reductase [Rhodococcus sp. X156]
MTSSLATSPLARPLSVRSLQLPNRVVMSPMTRQHSPGGVPGPDVLDYYRRRAAGGTGLVVTEGVAVDHHSAVDSDNVPNLHDPAALEGWRHVVEAVHAEGGRIIPQLWHVGPLWGAMNAVDSHAVSMRPSGTWGKVGRTVYPEAYIEAASVPTSAMTDDDITAVIDAFARSARNAMDVGFDGVAVHGGHGYLLDAFLWDSTNTRTDHWGGDLVSRTRFPAEVVRAIRAAIGTDAALFFRFSQHKQQDYTARTAQTPEELGVVLGALVEAGADVLDASARYFDAPAFDGSDLTLAGWAKKLTGALSMAVGSVGLTASLRDAAPALPASLDGLLERLGADEFDLVAVGRLHLADPAVAGTLVSGADLPLFNPREHLRRLY